jgi:hypothetical protein
VSGGFIAYGRDFDTNVGRSALGRNFGGNCAGWKPELNSLALIR